MTTTDLPGVGRNAAIVQTSRDVVLLVARIGLGMSTVTHDGLTPTGRRRLQALDDPSRATTHRRHQPQGPQRHRERTRAVCIPVQVDPHGPPFTASLQGTATVLQNDGPEFVGPRRRRPPRRGETTASTCRSS